MPEHAEQPSPGAPAAEQRPGPWRRVVIAAGLVLLVSGAFTAGMLTERQRAEASSEWSDTRLLSSAIDSVRANALDSLPSDELIRRAVAGMLRELHDPYAALLRPDGIEQYRGTILGEAHGLGLSLRRLRMTSAGGGNELIVSVARVANGSPAMAAGIRAGDRILAVDGVPVATAWGRTRTSPSATKSATKSSTKTSAKPGAKTDARTDTVTRTTRTPRVQRFALWRAPRGDTVTVSVTRAPWHMSAVSDAGLLTDSVGYVRLATMSAGSADELSSAVQRLVQQGAQALVLDLRGNGGGLFEEGVKSAALFLRRGAVVASLAGRTGARVQPHRARLSRWPDLPLTVLVDGGTASAAEVVAAALRDYDRALLVGSPTFGKGVVQRVVTLSSEMSLRLTTARWLTPKGVSLQRRSGAGDSAHGGLLPDVLLDDAARRDPYVTPVGWTPIESQRAGFVADSLAMHALRSGWSPSTSVLLPARLQAAIDAESPAVAPRTMRQGDALAHWRAVVARLALVRVLEVERGYEPLLRVALTDDAALRAGLDVAAPGGLVPTLTTMFASARSLGQTELTRVSRPWRTPPRLTPAAALLDRTATQQSLDNWLVTRFRGTRLLLDSLSASPAVASLSALGVAGGQPVIEATRDGARMDSLWAMHVSAATTAPTLNAPVTAQLVSPTGVAQSVAVRVVARRSVRLPRTASASAWRYGWAYLVLVPHDARRSSTRWRGWFIAAAGDTPPRAVRTAAQASRAP
jgi:carboxyl-terminal processing protease